MEPSLSQGAGFGLIIGGGVFFAVVMNYVTHLQNKFSQYNSHKVDEFVSGSRRVGFGLLLAGILLSWTWSLTLLESAVKSYSMGFCGSYYYAIEDFSKFHFFSYFQQNQKMQIWSPHSQKWGTLDLVYLAT